MKTIKLQEIKPGCRYVVVSSDEPERLGVGWLIVPTENGHKLVEKSLRFGPAIAWRDISATVRLDVDYHRAEVKRLRAEMERHERILEDE